MKTYSPKISEIERKWYVVDVKDKTLGHAATKIADILRGKNKPIFSPHLDCGDFVIVLNAKEVKLTGAKKEQKTYHHHTRYPGGLRSITAEKLLEKKPEMVVTKAIAGMLPKTKLRNHMLKKLKVYAGAEHENEAQKPTPLEL